MIEIHWQLGDVPSILSALHSPGTIQRVINAAAESYVDDIHDYIESGQAFTSRTGQLQQSINWHPNGDGSATVYANAEYALWVEEGTRAHEIRPRNRQALRFPVVGGDGFGFARVINHPGSQPHPFFFADESARGLRMQERMLSVLAQVANNG